MLLTKEQINDFVERIGQPKASVILTNFFNQHRKTLISSDVTSLYNDEYFDQIEHHETVNLVNDRYKLNTRTHFAYDYICPRITRETAVLDIGCGSGEFALAVASQGTGSVIGIDFSKNTIEHARSKLADTPMDNCSFFCDDVSSLHDKKLAKFDFIVLNDVTEHLADRELGKLFEQIEDVLAPSGEIVIHTPNGLALCSGTDSNLLRKLYVVYLRLFKGFKGFERTNSQIYYEQTHINIKSYRQLADLLKGFGYKTRVIYDEAHRFAPLTQLSSSMLVIARK